MRNSFHGGAMYYILWVSVTSFYPSVRLMVRLRYDRIQSQVIPRPNGSTVESTIWFADTAATGSGVSEPQALLPILLLRDLLISPDATKQRRPPPRDSC